MENKYSIYTFDMTEIRIDKKVNFKDFESAEEALELFLGDNYDENREEYFILSVNDLETIK